MISFMSENPVFEAPNTLAYEVDQNGQITFIGSSFGITAADGQKDNIQISKIYNKNLIFANTKTKFRN